MGGEVTARLGQLSSQAEELDASARLQILRDFFKAGQPAVVPFNMEQRAKRGHDFKDWFCPDSLEFYADFFKSDVRWGRVLYLQNYASFIKDDFIMELCGLDRSMMVSIDILPVPTDEAVRELQNKLLGVETNVAGWQRRQNNANNYTANVPYDMQLQRKETTEFLNDLTERDQRMMYGLVTVVHLAESKEQLDADTESLLAVGRKHLCQLSTPTLAAKGRPRHGTALRRAAYSCLAYTDNGKRGCADAVQGAGAQPHERHILWAKRGVRQHDPHRPGAAAQRPFIPAGRVGKRKIHERKKEELVEIALRTKDDILILDPESEFGRLVKALGGEVLPISPHSSIHLNALDIDRAYGEGKNPLVDKVKLILSIFEPLTENGLTAKQRSILDRCARLVYREYIRGGYRGAPPTLVDLRRILLEQPEAEAHDLALASELYTTGSLNIFAHQTNVDTGARILCYDIRELDEQLRPVGMVVTLDAIFNRVIRNWRQGKRTWILADEFYILFRYSFSAEFFYRLFKRMRKYNAFITAISQNVDEILRSDTARLMLANSELLVMLNQAATDREELAKLLNISENQLSYITNVPAGHGLIRCGGAIIPFENSFPKNTKLYQLMTTKPNEKFL